MSTPRAAFGVTPKGRQLRPGKAGSALALAAGRQIHAVFAISDKTRS